ncbi:MAG: hypothetical protein L3J23_02465 [Flavobacteriaceae bacterium]|nr:hypothetical protein [Flavobacteriaceae bacterium]
MKNFAIFFIVGLLTSCSQTKLRFDLSTVNSKQDLTTLIDQMVKNKVRIDSSSYAPKIVGKQGIHYNGILVNELTYFNNSFTFLTDSTDFSAKKILELLELRNGFGTYEEEDGFEDKPTFVWNNSISKNILELNLLNGKHLAAMGDKDFAKLTIEFHKQYEIPLANIHKEIKKYDLENLYALKVKSFEYEYQIWIDDIFIGNFNRGGQFIDLNNYILENGEHIIRYRAKYIGNKERSPYFEIEIIEWSKGDKKVIQKALSDEENKDFEFNFSSKIAYNLEGWKNGKDLRKDKQLKEKIIELYTSVGEAILQKDKQTINDLFYDMRKETLQVNYNNDFTISTEYWEYWLEIFENTYKYNVSQVFEIEYNAGGRLIYTQPKDKSDMLVITGKKFSETFNHLIYQPRGSNKLKFIRQ